MSPQAWWIADFKPNSGKRAAAEVLAGLKGLGVIRDWTYHPDEEAFIVDSPPCVEPDETLTMSARDVKAFGHGVRYAMQKWAPEPV